MRPFTRARLARVLGVFLLVGCSSLLGLEDGGLQGSSCSSASDCDPKHVCFEGQCRTSCVLGCKADDRLDGYDGAGSRFSKPRCERASKAKDGRGVQSHETSHVLGRLIEETAA